MQVTFEQLLEEGLIGRDVETIVSVHKRGPIVSVELADSGSGLYKVQWEWVAKKERRRYTCWRMEEDPIALLIFVHPDQLFSPAEDGSWITNLIGGPKMIIYPKGKNLDVGNVL